MATESKCYLWRKNIRGAFYAGYENIDPLPRSHSTGPGLLAFIHTLLLPITLTLGAGIKTIIDIWTRTKPLEDRVLEENQRKIIHLQEDILNAICAKIQAAKVYSLSSQRLQDTLCHLDREQAAQEEPLKGGKTSVITEMVRPVLEPEANIRKKIKAEVEFSEAVIEKQKKDLRKDPSQELAQISAVYAALKKDVIKDYFMSPGNNGKQLHQILVKQLEEVTENKQEEEKKNLKYYLIIVILNL